MLYRRLLVIVGGHYVKIGWSGNLIFAAIEAENCTSTTQTAMFPQTPGQLLLLD